MRLCEMVWDCRLEQFKSKDGAIFMNLNGVSVVVGQFVTMREDLKKTAVFCRMSTTSGVFESKKPITNAYELWGYLDDRLDDTY